MWPLTSPPSYPSLNASGRLDRAIGTLMAVAAALVIGASIGGASVFALVSALTAPPNGSERSTPAPPAVIAAPTDALRSVNPSAGRATTTTAIPAQTKNPAAQLQQPTSPEPATTPQSQVTSPMQEVKPWPDALSRASHPTGTASVTTAPTAATAWRAPTKSAPSKAAASSVVEQRPEAETAKRTAGRGEDSKPSRAEAPGQLGQSLRNRLSSSQRAIVTSQDARSAADENASRELSADDRRPIWDFFGDRRLRDDEVTDREDGVPRRETDARRSKADLDAKSATSKAHIEQGRRLDDVNETHAGSFGSSRPVIVEPRDRNYADERHEHWGDQRGVGFFGLFGRRDDRQDDPHN